ncbi:NitT/TauT family transport system substrate-binding protein [Streptomyces sp. TLI_053]|uniref:ABC transporter substrate-binding protein n=1 Tax=Streptomyces sp. TLI_053 TaxID=1855352 RepID=UPI00087DD691|nr:ABC transporter substrate-binding protein [Streptomyces sp. TLI_053]SDT80410.1 NitT/TauT family transport system substrate-binding protein [Streptomyces sp. TLI_053]
MPKTTARAAGALALLLAGSATLSACASDPTAAESSDGKTGGAVTVGLTYIPNIQFAPFYVAESKGFYKEAGLKVTLRHHSFTDDLFGAMTAGQEDVVYAGGDEMLQARAKDVPVVDIATLYHTYPVAMLVPQDSPIRTIADLRGHSVGTPGPYGETYFGLLAQLKAGGLTTKDVDVQHIGFTQQAALVGKKVDAVMGYLNNDAVQFQQAGLAVRAVEGTGDASALPLVAAGLGATRTTLDKRGDDIRKFVAATLRGVQYTVDHPDEAVTLSKSYIPGMNDQKQQDSALAVLRATAPLMQPPATGKPGLNDPATWDRMAAFMQEQGLIEKPAAPAEAFSNEYLP